MPSRVAITTLGLNKGNNRAVFRNPRGNKRYYSFWIDDATDRWLFYEYSNDGIDWEGTMYNVFGSGSDHVESFDVKIHDTGSLLDVYVILYDSNGTSLTYIKGTITDSADTISFSSAQDIIADINTESGMALAHSVAITRTANNELVVAFTEDYRSRGKDYRQTKLIGSDGDGAAPSWSSETILDDPSTSNNNDGKDDVHVGLESFSSTYGDRIVVNARTPDSAQTYTYMWKIWVYDWIQGTGFSEIATDSNQMSTAEYATHISAIVDNADKVHIAKVRGATAGIWHWTYPTAGGLGTQTTYDPVESKGCDALCLAIDRTNNALYLFYHDTADSTNYHWKTTDIDTVSWGTEETITISEDIIALSCWSEDVESAIHVVSENDGIYYHELTTVAVTTDYKDIGFKTDLLSADTYLDIDFKTDLWSADQFLDIGFKTDLWGLSILDIAFKTSLEALAYLDIFFKTDLWSADQFLDIGFKTDLWGFAILDIAFKTSLTAIVDYKDIGFKTSLLSATQYLDIDFKTDLWSATQYLDIGFTTSLVTGGYKDIAFITSLLGFNILDIAFKTDLWSADQFLDIGFKTDLWGLSILDIAFKTSFSGTTYKDIGFKTDLWSADTYLDIGFTTSLVAGDYKDIAFITSLIGFNILDITFKTSLISADTYLDIGFKTSLWSADTFKDIAFKTDLWSADQFLDIDFKTDLWSADIFLDIGFKTDLWGLSILDIVFKTSLTEEIVTDYKDIEFKTDLLSATQYLDIAFKTSIRHSPIIDLEKIKVSIEKHNEITMLVERSLSITMQAEKSSNITMIIEKKGIKR